MSEIPRERDIIIEDETLAAGFTVIPNALLRRIGLSPGAKLTFLILLSYGWQDDACFPGQETLARDVGVSDRSIRTYLRELEEAKLVTITQRGLNRTNLYVLHRIPNLGPENIADPDRKLSPGPEKSSGQDRKITAVQERQNLPTTNTQTDKYQKTIDNGPSEDEKTIETEAATHSDPVSEVFHIPEIGISSTQFWHTLLAAAESRATFSRAEIETWLRPSRLAGRDGDALVIAASSVVARDRLDARMLPQLRAVAATTFGAPVTFRVVVA